MKVMKFGGSCLQTAAGLERMLELVAREPRPVAIVLSALKGVTDDLIALTENAAHGNRPEGDPRLASLRKRHEEALERLTGEPREQAQQALAELFAELTRLLEGVSNLREAPPRAKDAIVSIGERLSVALGTQHFRQAQVPAVGMVADQAGVVTSNEPGDARILDESYALARQKLPEES